MDELALVYEQNLGCALGTPDYHGKVVAEAIRLMMPTEVLKREYDDVIIGLVRQGRFHLNKNV